MLTCTVLFWYPLHSQPFPLAGSSIGQEGLAEAVFMDWALTHVCHTRPGEKRPKTNKQGQILQESH